MAMVTAESATSVYCLADGTSFPDISVLKICLIILRLYPVKGWPYGRVQAGHMYVQHAERAAHTCGRLVPSLQGHDYFKNGKSGSLVQLYLC